jgi:hypothetical protein
MFRWNKEELRFKNIKAEPFGTLRKAFEDFASSVSYQDKFEFLDMGHDYKLTEIKRIVDLYRASRDELKYDSYGSVKTVSLKAWIKRNDPAHVFDIEYSVGRTKGFYPEAYLQDLALVNDIKGVGDRFENWVNNLFVETCYKLRTEEINYFNSTDSYEVAKTALRQYSERYSTTFNKHLGFCSDGNIFVYEDGEGEDVKKHNISIIEISEMLKKYRLLEKVDKLLTEGIGYHEISKTVDLVVEQNQIDMEVK